MTVESIYDEDALMLVLSIRSSCLTDETTADLNTALAIISDSLSDNSLYYRAVDLSGTWRAGEDEFNPWDAANVDAWVEVAGRPTSLTGLRSWLADLRKLLARHQSEKHTSIWEAEEVQLGEVPLSVLAIAHLEFVPIYADFLDVWDNMNAGQQSSVVTEIVQAHGHYSEVEDLLVKLVAYKGGDSDLIEYALRPELEKLYGDFSKSALFRRMVETMHARGSELQDSTGKRYIFSYLPSWPELSEAAQVVLAELDAR